MKPLGRKPHKRNFEDCHPPKGYLNWWEWEFTMDENKVADRQRAKKEIKKEYEDYLQARQLD